MSKKRAPQDDELQLLVNGEHCDVMATGKVFDAIQNLDDHRRGRLMLIMEKYCSEKAPRLPDTWFKSEGRFPSGNSRVGKIHVFAFKVRQFRVYGSTIQKTKRKYFICTDCDTSKKQDSANQTLLKQAATKLLPYL